MKRKELYNFIREEIVTELTANENIAVELTGTAGGKTVQSFKDKNAADKFKAENPNIKTVKTLEEDALDEMARKANTLKVGNPEKFEAAKDLYEGGWIANLLNFISEAGEDGIAIKELAEKLGKKESSNIHPAVQELKMVGAIASTRIKGDTSTEPEEDDVVAVAGGEEEVNTDDEEDSFFKVDKEFNTPEEEEPKEKDIKIEKVPNIGLDDEKIKAANNAANIVKKLSSKIKSMKKNDADYNNKMIALKQYIKNNRSILTKVSTINNLTGGLIS